MEEEIKKILNKNLAVSEETLKIIKKIHRVQSVGRFLKVFKWLMIAALSFGFYYYVQPYFETLWGTLRDIPFPPR
ncbi:MAG: hypothetical protein COT67_02100 [Candidatus Tagabacteria bacterium CG09_land_8_20_14_0_10_41_14]|uniref:Uncharacterized protein n=2 Tax=Candidatus Tagaibacteriota TaxID=1817918 RepID=A0A2H0WL29_9BACT|nr:MAG: hypothetical protein COT67_02100 [Candidatus Tagabacteria bacterium CG09_land_8_20_14_0_10_41_14]PJE72903.1 MAG: hypothetical protein COV00_02715 [Candidatus Tagabacteria bacterium CG10_big_fil_rev_8_21_14_0_10_40_13]